MRPELLRVLLVEDDEDDYLILLGMLGDVRGQRYAVDWVNSFEAGLEAIRRCEHDVYLFDYMLSDRSGLELLEQAIGEGCKEPIIFLTAYGDYDLDMRAMRAGAADYLIKGEISPQLLERSIRYGIQRKRIEDELVRHREQLEKLVEERTLQHAEARADAERRALEAEERRSTLEALLEHIPEGIAIVDAPNLKIRAISKYGLEHEMLAGIVAEEDSMHPRPKWNAFRPGGDQPASPREMPLVRAALDGEVAKNEEWSLIGHHGEDVAVLCSAGPIRDRDSHITGAIAIWKDISDLKAAQEQLHDARCELEERVAERTRELAEALESLGRSQKELRSVARQLLRVQEEERRRISREIHDSIGSSLSAVKLCVENLGRHIRSGTATPDLVGQMSSILDHAMEETRRIMTDLRPSILDDFGIVKTIDWLCRRHSALHTGAVIEKNVKIEESAIPDHLKTTIFRILQEAMSNTAKYSRADWVRISLVEKNGSIELSVEDNGVGFDPDFRPRDDFSGGFGLSGMKERAELSGGTFGVESEIGAGARITACWPVKSEERIRSGMLERA